MMHRMPRCPPVYRPSSRHTVQPKAAHAHPAPAAASIRRPVVPRPYRPAAHVAAPPTHVVQRVKWDTVESARDTYKTELLHGVYWRSYQVKTNAGHVIEVVKGESLYAIKHHRAYPHDFPSRPLNEAEEVRMKLGLPYEAIRQ
jgi:hypothetical protein